MARTETNHQTDADAIIEVAQDAMGVPMIVEPGKVYASEHALILHDMEKFGDAPRAKRGTVLLHTAAALVKYVNEQKTQGTALYADVKARSVVAVLNDHDHVDLATGDPGWRDHRAELHLRSTPEWDRWLNRDGKIGEQVAFAEHIEDGAAEITGEPDSATMLDLAQNIVATEKVSFRSAERLTDGQRTLIYDQNLDVQTPGVNGVVTVPEQFNIAIAPFEGGPRYALVARLRIRLNQGHLAIGYVLEGVEDVVRAAFDDLLSGSDENGNVGDSIEAKTDLVALRGVAPQALR